MLIRQANSRFQQLYPDDASIREKIERVASRIYGARDVFFYPEAEQKLKQFEHDGLGTAHPRGDAIAGVLLAEGACQAAARLVAINLAGRPGDTRLIELAELSERAAAIRADVLL